MDVIISVVIPCYNISEYVVHCIRGLKAQGLKNAEFIFVNDGSTDDTLEKIRIFSEQDERVKVIDKVNEGVSKARNAGLDASTGRYVYFLDGDDYLDDNALEIVAAALKDDCDLLILPHKNVRNEKIFGKLGLGIPDGNYTIEEFIQTVPTLPISYKIYKRSILLEHQIRFDEDLLYGEVYTFFFHYLPFCKSIKIISDALYNYVSRPSSAVHKINKDKELSYLKTISRINEYSKKYPTDIRNTLKYNRPILSLFNSMVVAKYIRNGIAYKMVSDVFSEFTGNRIFRNILLFMAKHESWRSKDKYVASMMLFSPKLCYHAIGKIYKMRQHDKD